MRTDTSKGYFEVFDSKSRQNKFFDELLIINREVNNFLAFVTYRVMVWFVLDFKTSFITTEVEFGDSAGFNKRLEVAVNGGKVDVGESRVNFARRKCFFGVFKDVNNFLTMFSDTHNVSTIR